MTKTAVLNIALFSLAWVLFVLAQAKNSIRSNSNGLQGKAGWAAWFQMHAIELAIRALVSAALYGWLINTWGQKIQAAGLTIQSYGIAIFAGFAANGALYQVIGLIPALRVEVGELAPPAAPPDPPKPAVQ